MNDLKKQELEHLAVVRLGSQTHEFKAMIRWLQTLETQAMEALVDCSACDHADRAARVQILRLLRSKMTAPTLEETQARYKVNTNA